MGRSAGVVSTEESGSPWANRFILMSFCLPHLYDGENNAYSIRLLEIKDNAVKSLAQLGVEWKPRAAGSCRSRDSQKEKTGLVSGPVWRGGGQRSPLPMYTEFAGTKEGLSHLTGAPAQSQWLCFTPLNRHQMEWSLVP